MKIIKTKWQKLIISLFIIITLFNVVFPTYAHADFGGTLFQPIAELICAIGDSVLNIMQQMMLPGAPKAVVERSAGDLIAEDLKNTGNPLDWVQGAKMSVDSWFAKQPLLGDLYRGATSFIKGFNPLNIAKNWVREVKKNGILGVINPLNYTSLGAINSEFQDFGEMFYENKALTPFILYSPYAIFSNSVPALDINFINPSVGFVGGTIKYSLANGKWDLFNGLQKVDENDQKDANSIDTTYTEDEDADPMKGNVAKQLQSTIATWYVALRNISIVAMLSVLIYVAIRIILSSTAGETAKYKTLLKDWLIGLCLLFTLHYMMAFMLKSVEIITDLFSSAMSDYELISEKYTEDGLKEASVNIDPFMTISRMSAVGMADSQTIETDLGTEFSYTLVYLVLVFYTLIFTWKYIKRFVYIAFLTMISPLVAFTYPIDKMQDGSAQAFNMWMKEYIYNVLIQPVHLLLYIILIGSAIDLASENLIYTVVATGFLLEAEKIVKSLFGFNKASGGSLSSAITGGAIFGTVAGATKNLFSKLPNGDDNKNKSGGSGENSKIRMNRSADSGMAPDMATAFAGNATKASEKTKGANLVRRNFNGKIGAPKSAGAKPPKVPLGAKPPKVPLGARPPRVPLKAKLPDMKKKSITGFKRVGKGIGNVVSSNARRYITKDNILKTAKRTIRLGTTVAGAAVGGTIGLAAGLASDNPGDILKYAGVGAGAGSIIGNKTVGAGATLSKNIANAGSSIKEDFQKGYYGKDYQEKVVNPKLDREWLKNQDNIEYYKLKYGDDYKNKMNEAIQLRKRGITDQKELDQGHKMIDKHPGTTYDQAAAIIDLQKDFTKKDMIKDLDRIETKVEQLVGDRAKAKDIVRKMEENFGINRQTHNIVNRNKENTESKAKVRTQDINTD